MKLKVIIMIFCMLGGFLIPSFGAKLPSYGDAGDQEYYYNDYNTLPSEQSWQDMDAYNFNTYDDEDGFPEGGGTDPEDGYNDAPVGDGILVLALFMMLYSVYTITRLKKKTNDNIK